MQKAHQLRALLARSARQKNLHGAGLVTILLVLLISQKSLNTWHSSQKIQVKSATPVTQHREPVGGRLHVQADCDTWEHGQGGIGYKGFEIVVNVCSYEGYRWVIVPDTKPRMTLLRVDGERIIYYSAVHVTHKQGDQAQPVGSGLARLSQPLGFDIAAFVSVVKHEVADRTISFFLPEEIDSKHQGVWAELIQYSNGPHIALKTLDGKEFSTVRQGALSNLLKFLAETEVAST